MSNLRYEFLMSQITPIRDIQDNEKTQLHMVQYAGCQGVALLRVCKGRDVSELYKSLMQIRHPNLTVIYDCVYANGNTYVVEEFVSGRTLEEILADKGALSEKEAIVTTTELCKALEVLHGQNPPIIHNDIKSSNVMVRDDGSVKLFDFDISRIYREDAYKNTKLMGTYEYAAPEHYGFGQSEPCTDIYSLGVTMHEMLTGEGLSPKREVTYTGGLAKVIGKCVEIDPKKRYASAAQLGARLERYAKGPKYVRKMTWYLGALVLILLLAGMVPLIGRSAGAENTQSESQQREDDMAIGQESQGTENQDNLNGKPQDSEEEEATQESEQDNTQEQNQTTTEETTEEVTEEATEEVSEESEIPNETESKEESKEEASEKEPGKIMEIVYDIPTRPLAVAFWPDGTMLCVEKIDGIIHLSTSTGKTVKLEDIKASKEATLYYDREENVMRFTATHYDTSREYTVSKELVVEEYVFVPPEGYDPNAEMELVGSVRNTMGYHMLKDRYYTVPVYWDYMDASITMIEVDLWGNYVNEFSMGADTNFRFSYMPKDGAIYNDGNYLYFVARKADKIGLFSFDGERFEELMCVSDYEGLDRVDTHTNLCVTDEALYLYNESKSMLMKFER